LGGIEPVPAGFAVVVEVGTLGLPTAGCGGVAGVVAVPPVEVGAVVTPWFGATPGFIEAGGGV
jgi:hypothetical protein